MQRHKQLSKASMQRGSSLAVIQESKLTQESFASQDRISLSKPVVPESLANGHSDRHSLSNLRHRSDLSQKYLTESAGPSQSLSP